MIYDELPLPWRFVDDLDKLTKNDTCTKCEEDLHIVTTDVTMLPSFVWVGSSFFTPISFLLRNLETTSVVDISADVLSDLKTFTIGTNVYVAMTTQFFDSMSTPLIEGLYQADITDGFTHLYSEPIRICSNMNHCVVVSWSNSCDLAGIPYTYLHTQVAGDFTNYMFVDDAPMLQAEYETETEEVTNILRQKVALYQSQERTLRFKTIGSYWIVKVFKAIELHDSRLVQYQYDSSTLTSVYQSLECESFEVEVKDLPDSECQQEIEVKFKQDDAIVNGICCVSNSPDACLTSCYTVVGFWPVEACTEGAYYMDDVDSGIIVQCIGGVKVQKSTTCTYALNSTDGNYYYYNGDLWQVTPDIDFDSYVDNGNGTGSITISGFMIPGTWGYVMYSCDNSTFVTYPTPFTAAQLAVGITITVQNCSDTFYLKMTSRNHTCTYDTSDTISFVPA